MKILDLIEKIDLPNRAKVLSFLTLNIREIEKAKGSSHNHQAWVGGYLDHVEETMEIAEVLHYAMSSMRPLPFSLSDALLVLFFHDIEKSWKETIKPLTKANRRLFRENKIAEAGIVLTSDQYNALTYVEGEGEDYSSERRVMGPLAAFCLMCDTASARIWFDKPDAQDRV